MTIHELDSVEIPLRGITLIEAAAGTGKTHNIQNLAARMIVEKNYPLESIVIVTFTNKAAAELSDRLRAVLALLVDFLQGKNIDDAVQLERAAALVGRFDRLNIDRAVQLERLNTALRDFDRNRVSTIHGFCERVLKENAFESSIAFRVELKKNINQYVEKLVTDFCRRERYSADPLPGADKLEIADLSKTVGIMRRRQDLEFENVSALGRDRQKLIDRLKTLLEEICSFPDPAGIMRNIPGRIKTGSRTPAELADELQRLLENTSRYLPEWSEWADAADPTGILEKTIYKKYTPAAAAYMENNQDFFSRITEFVRITREDCPVWFKMAALEMVRDELQKWKQRDNFQGFDDLLWSVKSALNRNEALLKTLQDKFNAAVIDEFQDTDPVQYEIFSKLFADRPDNPFFMVGDPRQAIYAFRGGDLATYLKARQECLEKGGTICTLSTNFRSSAQMIDGFNRLFEHNDLFASDQVKFGHVDKPENPREGVYRNGELIARPLSVEYCQGIYIDDILQKCACEIINLLNSRAWQIHQKDGSFRPVEPGDIAVLAYENWQLDKIRNYLEKFNVPVIGKRKSGIWGSPEAENLAGFLEAVINHSDENQIRQTLISPLCGVPLSDLAEDNEQIRDFMQAWQLTFADMARDFHKHGIAWLMRRIFREFDLKCRLITVVGGERNLANYTQLGDLLAVAELQDHLSPRGVLSYLKDQIAHAQVDDADDESSEMLDSDRSAVRLMTIHTAKGLQFPVVFLPALNANYPMKRKDVKVFHRRSRLCCNPGNLTDEQYFIAASEELQEIMRLVYVAVTRATMGCRMIFGDIKNCKNSPLDWLFGKRDAQVSEADLKDFLTGNQSVNLNIPPDLLQIEPFGSCEPVQYIASVDESELIAPEIVPPAVREFRVLSYSALNLHGHAGEDFPPPEIENIFDEAVQVYEDGEIRDYDSEVENEHDNAEFEQTGKLTGGIWDLPAGAAIGNAWHTLLEKMDFTAGVDRNMVGNIMRIYGFDTPEAVEQSCRMLEKLLEYQLPCGMRLKELKNSCKLNELEFEMQLAAEFDLARLLAAAEPHLIARFGRGFSAGNQKISRGFFTGFVDMIFVYEGKFYIVDWKSNSLQQRKSAFYEPELSRCMYDATYPMQYLCYSAALLRYLEHKLNCEFDEDLFERYYGGVYYIFLRGLVLDEAGGIFADRPPFAVVKALAEAIRGVKDEVKND